MKYAIRIVANNRVTWLRKDDGALLEFETRAEAEHRLRPVAMGLGPYEIAQIVPAPTVDPDDDVR
jgi:hypothetical protein